MQGTFLWACGNTAPGSVPTTRCRTGEGIVVNRLARIGDVILVPRMRLDTGKWDYEKATIMDLTETTMYLQDGTYILRGEYPLVDNSGYVR